MEASRIKFHYAGEPGEGWGWATCNSNLLRELARLVELSELPADVVFVPIGDHNLNPWSQVRGKLTFGYAFFESELGPRAAENAARFDVLFCGSTWCLRRLEARGIRHGRILIQGVDAQIFRPRPRVADSKFRIFSGGKFEWRKGQDLVIAAFKRFSALHPEAHLVCAWHNFWSDQIPSLSHSPHIVKTARGKTQVEFFTDLLVNNGLSPEQFTVLPMLPQRELVEWMAQTDCGLFPNRCEGGTNLVLMEYLSCGRPAAANRLTGHADLHASGILEIEAREDERGWASQKIEAVAAALERLWLRRDEPFDSNPPAWPWADTAKQIVEAIHACGSPQVT